MYEDESGRLKNVPSVAMLKQVIRKAMHASQASGEKVE
jgi:hypothetical protein